MKCVSARYLPPIYHWTFRLWDLPLITWEANWGQGPHDTYLCILQVGLAELVSQGELVWVDISQPVIAQETSVGGKSTVCPSLMKKIVELSHWIITKQIAWFGMTDSW